MVGGDWDSMSSTTQPFYNQRGLRLRNEMTDVKELQIPTSTTCAGNSRTSVKPLAHPTCALSSKPCRKIGGRKTSDVICKMRLVGRRRRFDRLEMSGV